MNSPKVITEVVNQDMCTGCGICTSECKSKSIVMGWNSNGFLVPTITGEECTDSGDCINVCPFNPFPKPEVKTEDELSQIYQNNIKNSDPKLGKYESLFVGYSKEYRKTSSSGGLATYFLAKLFENNVVDWEQKRSEYVFLKNAKTIIL